MTAPTRQPLRSAARRWVYTPLVCALLSGPLLIASVPAALSGTTGVAARRHGRLIARTAGSPQDVGTTMPRHSLLLLIPGILGTLLAVFAVFTVLSGVTYPVTRPALIPLLAQPFTPSAQLDDGAWGGPTLAGAWAAHTGVALVVAAVILVLLRGWAEAQRRLTAAGMRAEVS